MANNQRKEHLLQLIWENPGIQVSGIQILLPNISLSTINRDLKALILDGKLVISGTGRSTSYSVVQGHKFLHTGIGDSYFDKDIDDRRGNTRINAELFAELSDVSIFTATELAKLNSLQAIHLEKINTLSPALRQKENERLSIELSWKSSQIEGNTYSLLVFVSTTYFVKINVGGNGERVSHIYPPIECSIVAKYRRLIRKKRIRHAD